VQLNVNQHSPNDCDWQIVDGESVSNTLANVLDSVFSSKNDIFKDLESSYSYIMEHLQELYIINSQQDFAQFCIDKTIASQINLENFTLIAGKSYTSSISNKISDKNLFYCTNNDKYKFEITVEYCTECYWAEEYKYFWKMFPKINNLNLINE
jgi:hypothetical protein